MRDNCEICNRPYGSGCRPSKHREFTRTTSEDAAVIELTQEPVTTRFFRNSVALRLGVPRRLQDGTEVAEVGRVVRHEIPLRARRLEDRKLDIQEGTDY